MVIVTVTVKAAFQDAQCGKQVEDYIADALVNYLTDGQEAEVCFTTQRSAQYVKYPDWYDKAEPTDEEIEAWQQQAREEMEV